MEELEVQTCVGSYPTRTRARTPDHICRIRSRSPHARIIAVDLAVFEPLRMVNGVADAMEELEVQTCVGSYPTPTRARFPDHICRIRSPGPHARIIAVDLAVFEPLRMVNGVADVTVELEVQTCV